jgi:hypothetical protein
MIDARTVVGSHDILLLTLDSLRYDVARDALAGGETPHLAAVLPPGGWEARHSPATFTYAAHQAFFAGFLPTPARPGHHPRLFAPRFARSETTAAATYVFDAPDLVSGLAGRGYHTVCIGGTAFFDKRTALGSVLPGLFAESHWHPGLGVTDRRSTERQVRLAASILAALPPERRVFLFVNVSAVHQPSAIFLPGARRDSVHTQAAALRYVDRHLPVLLGALRRRGPVLAVLCSDHGTAFGEDGYVGHRLSHPVVLTVPYAEVLLPPLAGAAEAAGAAA